MLAKLPSPYRVLKLGKRYMRVREVHSAAKAKAVPLVAIPPDTRAYPLGTASNPTVAPLLTFGSDGLHVPSSSSFGLAVVGDGDGRRKLVETLLSKHKLWPTIPSPGPFPFAMIEQSPAPVSVRLPTRSGQASFDIPPPPSISPPPFIRHLTFSRPSATGEFTDYTARYGSLHESDRVTLSAYFATSLFPPPSPERISKVAEQLRITHLLDLPVVALSSGQTRRARIGAGLLAHPRVLLLEDPFAGLDPASRVEIGDILGEVNGTERGGEEETEPMRLILVLRGKGGAGLPSWITHISEVSDGEVSVTTRDEYLSRIGTEEERVKGAPGLDRSKGAERAAKAAAAVEPLVTMTDIGVTYGDKEILKSVSWSIRPGDRWHLQGSNGSGKTTLLSILLGHHPRSYSLPSSSLTLFGKPRRETVTSILKQKIGHASPEIFASFPRNMGLSAGEAIGSGFEGVFARRRLDATQKARVIELISTFKDLLCGRTAKAKSPEDIFDLDFAHYPPAQQALLMFLRAVVARPPLLVLDEASQGMDEASWERCRSFLEQEWTAMRLKGTDQAVICVSHYEEEVPWDKGQGKTLRLHNGAVVDTMI